MATYRLKQMPEDFRVTEEADLGLAEKGPFLVFRLRKTNYTTENAVQQIAKALHLPRKQLGYAGSKDSKAVTEQFITVRGAMKEKVLGLSLKDITLEFIGNRKEPLSLGDLKGNRFEIVIRDLEDGQKPKPIARMLNLFGEQRFSTNNADVGKAMLKKDFKKAAELISASSAADANTLDEHLSKSRNDYCGALKELPFKTLTIYVHAFQSRLWNRAAERLAEKDPDREDELLPLVGFGTEFVSKEAESICKELLEEEGVTQADFVIRAIPDLTSSGSDRHLYTEIQDLEIGEPEDDDLNPGKKKCRVTFRLDKGCYATEAVKAMLS